MDRSDSSECKKENRLFPPCYLYKSTYAPYLKRTGGKSKDSEAGFGKLKEEAHYFQKPEAYLQVENINAHFS